MDTQLPRNCANRFDGVTLGNGQSVGRHAAQLRFAVGAVAEKSDIDELTHDVRTGAIRHLPQTISFNRTIARIGEPKLARGVQLPWGCRCWEPQLAPRAVGFGFWM